LAIAENENVATSYILAKSVVASVIIGIRLGIVDHRNNNKIFNYFCHIGQWFKTVGPIQEHQLDHILFLRSNNNDDPEKKLPCKHLPENSR
jgi:hypothetical protein